jgi:hypothetical protein
MDKFSAAFDDPDATRAAERKINELTQTEDTPSYSTEFNTIAADLEDWGDAALMAAYRRGLNWKVKEIMSQKDNQPSTLDELIKTAETIDAIRRENKKNRPQRQQSNVKKATTTSTVTSTKTTEKKERVALKDDPNFVDTLERDARKTEGLCVKCGSPDHMFKQCNNGWQKKRVARKGKKAETAKVAKVETAKIEEVSSESEKE